MIYDVYGNSMLSNDGATADEVSPSITDISDIGAKIISGEIHTISLIGDSITDGGAGTGYNGSQSTALSTNTAGYCWANMLKKYLAVKYGTIVTNYGQYGSVITQQYAQLGVTVPAGTDLVIWLTGTNNRNDSDGLTGYKNVLKKASTEILEKAGNLILMNGITSSRGNENQHNHSMQDIANVVIPVAHEIGCKFVPMYNLFNEWLIDRELITNISSYLDGYGIHPNDAGYEIMLKILLRGLGIPVAYYEDLSVTGDYYPFT